jgi:YesN/AraC family two-component response regulator
MPRVLVVDDEPLMRDILRRMLATEDYDVEEAEDGLEGIQRYRAVPADVVITDLQMPRRNGLDMARELLDEFPDVKVIMISG